MAAVFILQGILTVKDKKRSLNMSMNLGNNIEDLDEEMEIITMIDDETEEEIEFVVIDRKKK